MTALTIISKVPPEIMATPLNFSEFISLSPGGERPTLKCGFATAAVSSRDQSG
jgi:hypothetical protein